ncbi:AMP-binding protein [Saccharopolyspora erythraea]|uniref:AMP-binding protein n=1 Tax=Saccharopolyspora erythraea TaxID=1836 RepID=UPI001BAE448D|nr:AMP-binding protein [Saccharopolyspora erythraea]QUH03338.1 AMP-binding protein [Saccharopolyspora erythraea]
MGAVEDYLADLRVRQQEVWPPGIPREVEYPLGERPVTEYVSHWARTVPDRVAYDFYGRRITYAELDELAARFTGWLGSVGVVPGERVGVFLPNCPQLVVAMLGVLRAGAVYVPINPMFREHELRHELTDAGVSVLLSLDALFPLVEQVRPDTALREVLVTAPADMLPPEPVRTEPASLRAESDVASGWARALAHPPAPGREADLDALAALNYTGGTTGMPKGCEHTQRHMIYTAATAAAASGIDVTGGEPEVFLIYVPIFWIAGEDFGILVPLFCGSTVVLLTRWDAGAVLEAVSARRVTTILGTVDNYVELMDHPDSGCRDLSSLRRPRAMSFVRKLTPRLRQRWRELAGPESVLREASYGMTETHTADSITEGFQAGDHDLLTAPVFCGLPVPGTEFMVVDEVTGEPLPLGATGEIVVRSPSLLTGYYEQPEATAHALRGGWLHTGDLGIVDEDGCLHYLGRNKEMIKVSGMSVFPSEVESLLARHPGVLGAAVVPKTDPERGQVPVAFVQPAPGAELDETALREWARLNMAPYKVPVVRLVDALPMTATGKIQKGRLLEEAERLTARP